MGHIIIVGIECGIGFFFVFSVSGAVDYAGKRAEILAKEVHRRGLKMEAENERMNEVLETLQQIRDQTWETNQFVGSLYNESAQRRLGVKL